MNRSLLMIAAVLLLLSAIPACKRANEPTPPQAATSRPAPPASATAPSTAASVAAAAESTPLPSAATIELITPSWAGDVFRWETVHPDTPDAVVQSQAGKQPIMLLPPGDYQVAIRPTEFDSSRLLWPGVIHLGEGQHVTARLDSGIAPPPQLAALPPPFVWAMIPAASKGRTIPVQHARGSWSAMLVPPGEYRWVVHTVEFNTMPVIFPEKITISPGELATPDPPAVLRITIAAGSEKPFRLRLAEPGRGKTVAENRNGAVQVPMIVPPGDYDLYCQPQEFATNEVRMARELHLPAGQPVDFPIDTGIRIAGPAGAEPRFDAEILDASKPDEPVIQHAHHTWSTEWLPPGKYRVRVRAAESAPWESAGDDVLTIAKGKIATITMSEIPTPPATGLGKQ